MQVCFSFSVWYTIGIMYTCKTVDPYIISTMHACGPVDLYLMERDSIDVKENKVVPHRQERLHHFTWLSIIYIHKCIHNYNTVCLNYYNKTSVHIQAHRRLHNKHVCVCVCALQEVTGSASTSSQMLLLLWMMAIVGHRKGRAPSD